MYLSKAQYSLVVLKVLLNPNQSQLFLVMLMMSKDDDTDDNG